MDRDHVETGCAPSRKLRSEGCSWGWGDRYRRTLIRTPRARHRSQARRTSRRHRRHWRSGRTGHLHRRQLHRHRSRKTCWASALPRFDRPQVSVTRRIGRDIGCGPTARPRRCGTVRLMARFVYIDETGAGGRKQPVLTLVAAIVDEAMVQLLAAGRRSALHRRPPRRQGLGRLVHLPDRDAGGIPLEGAAEAARRPRPFAPRPEPLHASGARAPCARTEDPEVADLPGSARGPHGAGATTTLRRHPQGRFANGFQTRPARSGGHRRSGCRRLGG
jgi:hypothetical protein